MGNQRLSPWADSILSRFVSQRFRPGFGARSHHNAQGHLRHGKPHDSYKRSFYTLSLDGVGLMTALKPGVVTAAPAQQPGQKYLEYLHKAAMAMH